MASSCQSPRKNIKRGTVLRNYVRHADTHNRVQEEMEMWRLRKLERQSRMQPLRNRSRSPITRGRLLSDTMIGHEEDMFCNGERESSDRSQIQSTYWTRQLMKAEESDPHRWGHSGYKELYPEEFISTDEEKEHAEKVKPKEKKRKKERLKKRTKSVKSEADKKKLKKKKRRQSVSSEELTIRTKKIKKK